MLAWRIYYDGGSRFDSSMGMPPAAPPFGCICILQRSEDGFRVERLVGKDHYLHDGRLWLLVDESGVWDRLAARMPIYSLVWGRTVADSVYQEIIETAKGDRDFYSAFTKEEVEEFVRKRANSWALQTA